MNKRYTEEYFSSWGLRGDVRNVGVERMKRATFELRLDRIGKYVQAGNILDVGCATGIFLQAAQGRGYRPYGIDVSGYAVSVARRVFADEQIVMGTLETCPFENSFFDVLVMSDLLEHVPDPLAALDKACQLLRKGGIILIVTPDIDSMSRTLMGRWWPHYKAEHLVYFSENSMTILSERSGLSLAHLARARKALNLDYLFTQYHAYPSPILTPFFGLLHSLLPIRLRRANVIVTVGEMEVVLQKR